MGPPDAGAGYEVFRREAVGNPKRARELLGQLLAGPQQTLQHFLELAARPGEGRVREVVAVAYRLQPAPSTVLGPWLERWLPDEPDEFARRAIRSALDAHRPRPTARPVAHAVELPRDFADTYRYVSERLCHRVRNSLGLPDTQLVRLARLISTLPDPATRSSLTDVLAKLRTGFERIAQAVEFDIGDGYLEWADLALGEWLRTSVRSRYAARLGAAELVVESTPEAQKALVRAAPFLLDTVFANIWANAVEAAGPNCALTLTCSLAGSSLDVLVQDNGPGLPESVRETVFQAQFSTKAGNRGRGLLEIAEAMGRLQGYVSLVPTGRGENRIKLSFPAVPA